MCTYIITKTHEGSVPGWMHTEVGSFELLVSKTVSHQLLTSFLGRNMILLMLVSCST